ncbi:alpha/beta fold hydrolase [Parvibium lacunae]|uniref:Peptidase S9 prolyl oligopeptidase catalytic domain-containing protein n=1 Tax=Parvibium lacunae TaxID=1888893 RepID=A0A368L4C9_9BURK|nr:prolyl oligopeptidase family serine peptidase [Parvibium lacunae]RCS58427.1 hypothetical protein DU000_06335 [Parvibium lacunae]
MTYQSRTIRQRWALGFVIGILYCVVGCQSTSETTKYLTTYGVPLNLVTHTFQFSDGGQSSYYEMQLGPLLAQQPVIFVLGGAGCARGESALRHFFDSVQGSIQVWMLEKRGVANSQSPNCSNEYHRQAYAKQIVGDQIEFIQAQLRKLPTVALRPVILLGISEGGMIAPAVAQSLHEVTHLALVGAGGLPLRQELQLLVNKHRESIDVPTIVNAIQTHQDNSTILLWGNSVRWWGSFLDYSSVPYVAALKQPMLVAMGELDTSVPLESAMFLRRQSYRLGKRNIELLMYPRANHFLASPVQDYRNDFLRTLLLWVREGRITTPYAKAYSDPVSR